MELVEKHIINETNELNELSFKCKNLYNKVLYITRQNYINDKIKPNRFYLFTECKNLSEYKLMSSRVSRGVIRTLVANWDGYFSSLNNWFKHKEKFNGRPKLPKYLDKKGKFLAIFTEGSFSKKYLKNNIIKLSKLKIQIPYQHINNKIVEVQVIPYKNKKYKINIIYKHQEKQLKLNNNKFVSIDLGLNNLMSITSNTGLKPLLVNGRALKSLNQFYNKRKSFYTSELELKQKKKISKKLEKLSYKRENKINDYLHKSSRYLINYCIENGINTIIIGYNKSWKQNIRMGKKNNQNFVQIPFFKLIQMIEYKAKLEGLNVIKNEESYTSKCSFLDNEPIYKQDNYKGVRVKRGLFKSSKGLMINADINASYNIMKKVVPNAFVDGIEGVSIHPIKINFN